MSSRPRLAPLLAAVLPVLAAAAPVYSDERTNAVARIFATQYAGICSSFSPGEAPPEPRVHELAFRFSYDTADAPQTLWSLVEYDCVQGAYNFGSVFYTVSDWDEVGAIQFAMPVFEASYAIPDDVESALTGVTLTGFAASDVLYFAEFDPQNLNISHSVKWRGIGDASEGGSWTFRDGRFVLTEYWVDASYDGEINPVQLYPKP